MVTISNLLRSDSPESTTRLCFLLIVLNIVGWVWYALINKTTVPHIESLLTFAGATLAWKQFNERKANANPGGSVTNP